MLIELELNTNDAEALLRHCDAHQPDSGDVREDSRLRDALETLACAVRERMSVKGTVETVDPRVLEAATAMFGNAAFSIEWLSRPLRALGGKRPIDVDAEEVITLIARLEHGLGA